MEYLHWLWLASTTLFLAWLIDHVVRCRTTTAWDRVQEARRIINFEYAGKCTKEQRLALRADPNQRLFRAFGITNSFTTADFAVHRSFRTDASSPLHKMARNRSQWQTLYGQADAILGREIEEQQDTRGSSEGILLAPCVRRLCLRLVLGILFGVDPLRPSTDDITTVVNDINYQWVRSKSTADIAEAGSLNDTLSRLLQLANPPNVPVKKALALILPAYETLWRVILLTFISASHRSPSPVRLEQLDVPACLGRKDPIEKQALTLANEGLRLYPSSKRVYRQSLGSDPPLSADVEACHREKDIWGLDALEFRPDRFDSLTALQKEAYFPFGLPPHQCPAQPNFGVRFVALLVVVLGSRFGADKARVHFADPALDLHPGTPLPTGRDSMDDWVALLRAQESQAS